MKRYLEFTIDFVLSGLLLGIIAVSFLLTYNLTPITQSSTNPILGAVTKKPIPLIINTQVKRTILDEHNQALSLQLGKLVKGEHSFYFASAVNDSDQTQSLLLSTKISKINLNNVRYDLVINGTPYLIYDDRGDKQVRDLKLDIKAGETVGLNLKATAYTNIGYAIELIAQINY